MTGAEFLWVISTVISLLNSYMGREGEKKIQAYQTTLKNLRKDIDAKNLVSQEKLGKLQSALSSLQSMRVQLDPRIIGQIDDAIDKVTSKINDTNADILKNESEYNQKAAEAPMSAIAANTQSWNDFKMNPISADMNNNRFDQSAGILR